MANQLPQGFLLSGICKGAKEVTENGYTNNRLFIQTGEYPNEVGDLVPDIQVVELFGDRLAEFMDKANKSIGKPVVIAVNRSPAKKELRLAFMRNSINRRSELLVMAE